MSRENQPTNKQPSVRPGSYDRGCDQLVSVGTATHPASVRVRVEFRVKVSSDGEQVLLGVTSATFSQSKNSHWSNASLGEIAAWCSTATGQMKEEWESGSYRL